jgi:rhodanese-related sulfurtransferase
MAAVNPLSDDAGYAGDLEPRAAWALLEQEPDAVLLDVRTEPEWEYVGRPDLTAIGRRVVLVPWKHWPEMKVRETFADEVRAAGIAPDAPVLLLCRSGQRSRDAAIALTAAGFRRCYNIADGFEGTKDANGHRNTVSGWRVAGLPWVQG